MTDYNLARKLIFDDESLVNIFDLLKADELAKPKVKGKAVLCPHCDETIDDNKTLYVAYPFLKKFIDAFITDEKTKKNILTDAKNISFFYCSWCDKPYWIKGPQYMNAYANDSILSRFVKSANDPALINLLSTLSTHYQVIK